MKLKIAFDADGAERPLEVAEALRSLINNLSSLGDCPPVHVLVFGRPEKLKQIRPPLPFGLVPNGDDQSSYSMQPPEYVTDRTHPREEGWTETLVYGNDKLILQPVATGTPFPHHAKGASVRRYKQSSIYCAISALQADEVHAVVSPGNTGGTVAMSVLKLSHHDPELKAAKIRPVLPVWLPMLKGDVLIGDVGANPETDLETLLHTAVMLGAYYRLENGTAQLRMGILTVGEEGDKGSSLINKAKARLVDVPGFVGSAEPYQMRSGEITVAVTDGHTGNLYLKGMETILGEAFDPIREARRKTPKLLLGLAALAAPRLFMALQQTGRRMDRDRVGGAPLLGITKPVIVCHGGVGALGIVQAIYMAARACESQLCQVVHDELLQHFQATGGSSSGVQDASVSTVEATTMT